MIVGKIAQTPYQKAANTIVVQTLKAGKNYKVPASINEAEILNLIKADPAKCLNAMVERVNKLTTNKAQKFMEKSNEIGKAFENNKIYKQVQKIVTDFAQKEPETVKETINKLNIIKPYYV